MVIGQITGSFGVHGEAKVEVLTDFPERFGNLDRVFLGPKHQEYALESVRPHQSLMLVRLAGITTPEAVDKLRGQEMAVPRAEAAPLPEGHYYLEDLIGLRVVSSGGAAVGRVRDVIRTGSNDVYVVWNGAEEFLIPAIRDAVLSVDIPAGIITVEPWVLRPPE